MPKYRQLHLKILDSVDVNEMPDDFTRLTWVLLSLIVDSSGRGVDNPAWMRSKMYPLRDDINLDQIKKTMDWFGNHRMILRYSICNRNYFCIPTWPLYQSGTDREAPSSIPAPEQLLTNSVPAPDELPSNQPMQLTTNQPTCENPKKIEEPIIKNQRAYDALKKNEARKEAGEADVSWLPESLRPLAQAFMTESGIHPTGKERSYWHQSLMEIWEAHIQPDILIKAIKKMRKEPLTIKGPGSCLAIARDLSGKKKGGEEYFSEVYT
jgi:hypothetical protein